MQAGAHVVQAEGGGLGLASVPIRCSNCLGLSRRCHSTDLLDKERRAPTLVLDLPGQPGPAGDVTAVFGSSGDPPWPGRSIGTAEQRR